MQITQLAYARPLISHIPSKATTFEDYHISISFFGKCAESVKMGISEEYSFQHLSQNTTLTWSFVRQKNYDVC